MKTPKNIIVKLLVIGIGSCLLIACQSTKYGQVDISDKVDITLNQTDLNIPPTISKGKKYAKGERGKAIEFKLNRGSALLIIMGKIEQSDGDEILLPKTPLKNGKFVQRLSGAKKNVEIALDAEEGDYKYMILDRTNTNGNGKNSNNRPPLDPFIRVPRFE